MAEMKTRLTAVSPTTFLNGVEDDRRRQECRELIGMMRNATGKPAKMWGSIVGFDTCRIKYANGREIDFMLTGFAPRKQDLVLYLGPGLEEKALLAKLGRHRTGKGCLYIKRLDDIDRGVLQKLIGASVKALRSRQR
jgi:hypothetical protein